jgi:hypothetical protein
VNQDLGIKVSSAPNAFAPDVIGWKESGGSAGTFSPNAAYLEAILPVAASVPYDVTLAWKANHATTGAIRANAGLSPNFSQTRLTVQLVCS